MARITRIRAGLLTPSSARARWRENLTRDDIMTFDMASFPQDGGTRRRERFIHGEIFMQRPDGLRRAQPRATVTPLPRVPCP
jgi:hypothetical protein